MRQPSRCRLPHQAPVPAMGGRCGPDLRVYVEKLDWRRTGMLMATCAGQVALRLPKAPACDEIVLHLQVRTVFLHVFQGSAWSPSCIKRISCTGSVDRLGQPRGWARAVADR